jgi:hypothetical protein
MKKITVLVLAIFLLGCGNPKFDPKEHPGMTGENWEKDYALCVKGADAVLTVVSGSHLQGAVPRSQIIKGCLENFGYYGGSKLGIKFCP